MFGNQDFASTQGPFISPEMFREFALPAIQSRVRNVHEEFNMPVFKHACGNNNKLLDMFIENRSDFHKIISHLFTRNYNLDLSRCSRWDAVLSSGIEAGIGSASHPR